MDLRVIQNTVGTWPGVTQSPHRFGGVEFTLGGVEIGHIHSNGMVDIPFNTKIRDQLIAEKRVLPHHLLNETGWITFYIRSAPDVDAATWLFRLSYLFYATRGKNRATLRDTISLPAELDKLGLSETLRNIFESFAQRA